MRDFPISWKTAIIIPVPKPGRVQGLIVTDPLPLLAVCLKQ